MKSGEFLHQKPPSQNIDSLALIGHSKPKSREERNPHLPPTSLHPNPLSIQTLSSMFQALHTNCLYRVAGFRTLSIQQLSSMFQTLFITGILALYGVLPSAHATPAQQALRKLYSQHFELTPQGIPSITVGLMERQTRVTLSFPQGGTLHFFSPNQTPQQLSIQPKQNIQVRILRKQAARVRYWLSAFRLPLYQKTRWQQQQHMWKRRQISVTPHITGTIFSMNGRLFDQRQNVGVFGFHSQKINAQREATKLSTRYQTPIRIHEQILHLPQTFFSIQQGARRWNATQVITFRPRRGSVQIKRVEHGRGYRWHGFQTRTYIGEIILAPDRNGTIAVINRVPLPALLRGVLPAEMPHTAPIEALKAQAVCARNEILAKIGLRHQADPYLFCAHTHCQVYAGNRAAKTNTDRAIAQTRGQVMQLSKHQLADASYSAICGGHTEHNEHVWYTTPNPALRGKLDNLSPKPMNFSTNHSPTLRRWLQMRPKVFCNHSRVRKNFRWSRTLEQTQVTQWLNATYKIGTVEDIFVLKRGVSGRIHALRVQGKTRTILLHGELHIRRLFGNLPSSLFVIQRRSLSSPRRWFLRGGGWGHGVGMCQQGAIGRAYANQNYQTILKHYFSRVQIQRAY